MSMSGVSSPATSVGVGPPISGLQAEAVESGEWNSRLLCLGSWCAPAGGSSPLLHFVAALSPILSSTSPILSVGKPPSAIVFFTVLLKYNQAGHVPFFNVDLLPDIHSTHHYQVHTLYQTIGRTFPARSVICHRIHSFS